MSLRLHVCALAALGGLLAIPSPGGEPAAKDPKAWTPPRTADGHPDLSGYWSNATYIPLERPKELGTKEFFTEAEAAAYEKKKIEQDHSQAANDIHYDNVIWQGEKNSKDTQSRRTSIIFDPPDGRVPPLTEQGQKRAAQEAVMAKRRAASESAESRSLAERCITWGADGPPMLGSTYNANVQILQTASNVVVLTEMMHDARVIPLDASPHLPSAIHQLTGDSRGHWEGDTLVVDSTNFNEETNFRGPPATARQDIFSSPQRVPFYGGGSGDLDQAVVGRASDEQDQRPDIRVRLPRRQLRAGGYFGGSTRGGSSQVRGCGAVARREAMCAYDRF